MAHFFASAMRGVRPSPRLAALLPGPLQTLLRSMLDPYRPELHYMRGPGPKWRDKHPASAHQPRA
jgi:hypothetical protein